MDVNKYIGSKIRSFREIKNITQQELADYLETTPQTISRYEIGDRKTTQDILFKLADYFKVSINDFFPELNFNNANPIKIDDITLIPVLGVIKAGIPIEAQQDIIEYIDIPKSWTKGGKSFYGLKISGDSMYPNYNDKDIVIFEQTADYERANGKDCAVMVNGFDATFKKVSFVNETVVLQPYNTNYEIKVFNKEQIEELPVKIIGIAKEKRIRL